jgi:hypothetical protein
MSEHLLHCPNPNCIALLSLPTETRCHRCGTEVPADVLKAALAEQPQPKELPTVWEIVATMPCGTNLAVTEHTIDGRKVYTNDRVEGYLSEESAIPCRCSYEVPDGEPFRAAGRLRRTTSGVVIQEEGELLQRFTTVHGRHPISEVLAHAVQRIAVRPR